MSVRLEILGLIIACMVVTFVPRVLPLLLVHKVKLPPVVLAWLAYVPAAVISALFFNEITFDGTWRVWENPRLVAGIIVLLVAIISRSIYLTVIAGMGSFVLLQWLAAQIFG